jgi:glutathione synthase/RimK-type ligase-like ATP-grasp enzyme
MMVFPAGLWINHPAAVYAAEVKAVQLRTAATLGFDVPVTRMTNDPDADVARAIGPHIALKSIDTLLLRDGDDQLFGYTTLLDWGEVAVPELAGAPVTVQQPLTDKLDLRVTVLGRQLWCAAVRKGSDGIEGDWRLTKKDDLAIEDYVLPDDVAARCLRLVETLGLRFGAVDLAVSDGRYWFIEINPTGEWGWLDTPRRRLSVAIAEELSARPPVC